MNDYNKENYVQPDAKLNSPFWAKNITTVLLRQYGPQMHGNVADFGCNHGLWAAMVSQNPAVNKVCGFDLNREALSLGLDKVLPQVPNTRGKIDLRLCNLTELDWDGELFDFAYSFHTLEHIFPEHVETVMNNMANSIKPEGLFLLNLPEKDSYHWEKSHVYHITLKELDDLLDAHGFDKIESYHDERGGQHGHSRNITGLYRKRT